MAEGLPFMKNVILEVFLKVMPPLISTFREGMFVCARHGHLFIYQEDK
jgi:hypothetical protein